MGCDSLGPLIAGTGPHGWRCIKCFETELETDGGSMCLACYAEHGLAMPHIATGLPSRRPPDPVGATANSAASDMERLYDAIALLERKCDTLNRRVIQLEHNGR